MLKNSPSRRSIRARLSFSNLVSLLALFIALGGASWAAVTLPSHSVGTRQLQHDAVTSPKVRNHSLLAEDFKNGELPAGRPGPTGPAGTAGAKGDNGRPGPKGDPGTSGATNAA